MCGKTQVDAKLLISHALSIWHFEIVIVLTILTGFIIFLASMTMTVLQKTVAMATKQTETI